MAHQKLLTRSERLRSLPDVGALPEQTLAEIDSKSYEVLVPAGQVFVEQGRVGRQTFIITEGEVAVRRDGDIVAIRPQGHLVGEIAVLCSGLRTADLIAMSDLTMLVMSPAELVSLCAEPAFRTWAHQHLTEHAAAS